MCTDLPELPPRIVDAALVLSVVVKDPSEVVRVAEPRVEARIAAEARNAF